jgi:hypothetical protein
MRPLDEKQMKPKEQKLWPLAPVLFVKRIFGTKRLKGRIENFASKIKS